MRQQISKFKSLIFPRKLSKVPEKAKGNFSSVLINNICKEFNEKFNYLEIGSQFGYTLEAIKSVQRVGIDPKPMHRRTNLPIGLKSLKLTSDQYFASIKNTNTKFNFIYIDGLHTFEQVYKDFVNSYNHITSNGYILLDDVIPVDAFSAGIDQKRAVHFRNKAGNSSRAWQGDCFKLLVLLSEEYSFLQFKTIIYPGNAQTLVKVNLSNAPLKFDRPLYDKYNNLTFSQVFLDFKKCSEIFKFEFGWNFE
jgi:hypothetical protein